jgi:DNA-binding response OmpR family regulator
VNRQFRILIIDDEPYGRQLLEAILLEENYHLMFAESGQKAIKHVNEFLPDLILLDIMMPEINGFEICQIIRSNVSTSKIPIILITALDDRDSKKKGFEVGANDYIPKPFNRNEVLVKVKNLLNNS